MAHARSVYFCPQLQATPCKIGACLSRKVGCKSFSGNPFLARKGPLQAQCQTSCIDLDVLDRIRRRCLGRSVWRCHCLGTVLNPGDASILPWVPVADQILLMASAVFAYMAGAISMEKSSSSATRNIKPSTTPNSYTTSGSASKKQSERNLVNAWNGVQDKLSAAQITVTNDGYLDNEVEKFNIITAKSPLSLHAIGVGPWLRLLMVTLLRLQTEVYAICETSETLNRVDWLRLLTEITRASFVPICIKWLQDELSLKNKKQSEVLLARMFEDYKVDYSVLSLVNDGKEDLYTDLVFFLRFGKTRTEEYYDTEFLSKHQIAILEDFLVFIADKVTKVYLEMISIDSAVSTEMNSTGLNICFLSTRDLQRLRNQSALSSWWHQNMEAVVSMYEDRFVLNILEIKPFQKPSEDSTGKISWWLRLARKKPLVLASSSHFTVGKLSLPVKRTKELRALTGWMYYFSLFLEFSDIAKPIITGIFEKISSGLYFLLVCLIGRSLGLVCTGIRQSLRW